jgi:hypothetical protein
MNSHGCHDATWFSSPQFFKVDEWRQAGDPFATLLTQPASSIKVTAEQVKKEEAEAEPASGARVVAFNDDEVGDDDAERDDVSEGQADPECSPRGVKRARVFKEIKTMRNLPVSNLAPSPCLVTRRGNYRVSYTNGHLWRTTSLLGNLSGLELATACMRIFPLPAPCIVIKVYFRSWVAHLR